MSNLSMYIVYIYMNIQRISVAFVIKQHVGANSISSDSVTLKKIKIFFFELVRLTGYMGYKLVNEHSLYSKIFKGSDVMTNIYMR